MIVAATGAAYADALPTPSMAGPLAANASPYSVDLPDWLGDAAGKVYVTGAVTGLAYYESSPTYDPASNVDVSNAQVFLQKTDGWLQFYAQFGLYSLPTIGQPYTKAVWATPNNFGYMPVGYVKLQGEGDWADFSVQVGKLPTLIGDEYTFTFENMNVERGLLWNLEPAVSRGIQVNYAEGPLSISVSWNDGTYSDVFSSLSGLVSYGFNGGADTLAFAAGGNVGSNQHGSALNSGSYYNLIYTHTSGPWTISPYIQYVAIPKYSYTSLFFLETFAPSNVWGGALLVSYSIDDNWKLAARVEYEGSSGNPATTYNIIGYGAGSNAWSLTVTPTYQWKQWFARLEPSYISAGNIAPFDGFGHNLDNKDQFRVMLETGLLF
jgi:hypothetical protein